MGGEKQSTILTELLKYITRNNLLPSHLAEKAGINSGAFSRIMSGSQTISVKILDKVSVIMGLNPGELYEQYVDELIIDESTDWRRLKPFLIRCSELGKLSCIERIIGFIMEKQQYIPLLFEVAESLENKEAAIFLFKKVADAERYQHSERLAIAQYRIFKLMLSDDQDNNLECAIQFEPFIARLDESEQLDAFKDLANLYLSLRRWEKAKYLVGEMKRLSSYLYEQKYLRIKKNKQFTEPQKPLFGYILYANLLLGSIAEEQGDFSLALHYVSKYEHHDWIVESDYAAEQTKRQFSDWATANRYLYKILAGEVELINEYIAYIESNEGEVFHALFKIVRVALEHEVNIDTILNRFVGRINDQVSSMKGFGSYSKQVVNVRLSFFLLDLSKYYIHSSTVDLGIKYLLDSLAISVKINHETCLLRGLFLFEEMRNHVTDEQYITFKRILGEAQYKK
ncbi:XRE family transcriptional regulator [Paenibacillus illinoisensis]|uniref:XRE family transcriptional regulator n=1 Tax=Paenibacillus illinoisensis TaxID=59845 RepID=UPI00301C9BDA